MTTDTRHTHRALVDVVIHVPAIVCLAPDWTHARRYRPRVYAPQTTLVPPLNNTQATTFAHPQHYGTWLVAP